MKTDEQIFDEFKEIVLEQIIEQGLIDDENIEKMIDNQAIGKWRIYYSDYYRKTLLALDVKGYGAYGDEIQIEDYFRSWASSFDEDWGLELYVAGRSGGWWGFCLKDIIEKGFDVFELNDDALLKLYLRHSDGIEEDEGDIEDIAYDAINDIPYDEIANYVKFNQDFIFALRNFEDDIKKTSDEWEKNGR